MSVVAGMLDIWGAAMWRASWQAGLLALAVCCVCRLFPWIPARFQCWLWRLAMLKFVVALVLSVPIEVPLLPAAESTAEGASEMIQPSALPTDYLHIAELQPPSFVPLLLIPFIAWIVGVVWQIARLIAARRNAVRLRYGCRPSKNRQLFDCAERFCKLLGISFPPPLLETVGQGSPLLVGILRPAIVLPTTTLSLLDAAERALVLGHELAHAYRRDLLWNLVAASVRTIFFFHPLAWFSERQLGLTQEIAADELAIALQNQTPARYATLLLSIVSKLGPGRMLPMMSVGAAGSHSFLKQRLSAMRFMKQASSRFVLVYALALGASAALCLVPWSVVATTASADEAKPKEAIIKGKFVSFKDGVLQVKVKDEPSDVVTNSEWKVAEDTKVVSHIRGESKEGIAREAFKLWEPEAVIAVKLNDGKVTLVELGIKKTTDRIPDRVPDKTPDKAADKSPDRLPEKTPDKKGDKASQKPKFEHGRFVSIKNGTLTIEANSGDLVENKVPPNTKTLVWDAAADKYLPADTASTLKQVKVGTPTVVNVDKESITLRFGSRKGKTTGTFVSYKNDRLLILGIFPEPNSFTKKYGNNVHFNKFREDVPAYERVDGGEYELIGMANKVLGDVKEGTLVTVHAEGDDNITLVQIGVPKKK